MSRKSDAEIQVAIHECLELCRSSTNRLSTLMEYMLKLKAEGWSAPEIRKMEGAVVRILAELVTVQNQPSLIDDHIDGHFEEHSELSPPANDQKPSKAIELFLVNMDGLRSCL